MPHATPTLPHATLTRLPSKGHALPYEHPDECAALLLDRLRPPSRPLRVPFDLRDDMDACETTWESLGY